MYNFCVSALKSEAESNILSKYSYEAKNLVEWERWNNKGYQPSENKTPIEIIVKFFCHIEIKYIVFLAESEIAKQRATIEIYANSGRYKDTLLGKVSNNESSWIVLSEKTIHDDELDVRSNVQAPFATYTFMSNMFKCTKALKIKIIKGSLECIRDLEVWGKPGPYIKKLPNVWADMLRVYERQFRNRFSRPTTVSLNDYIDETPEVELPDDIEIPFEFLDQITFKLMTSPIILPCGKIIDRTTSDMFMRYQERNRFRMIPFDPFTGISYSENTTKYPKTATALKARINEFLLLHASKIKYIPRRLIGISAEKVDIKTTPWLIPSTSDLLSNKRKRKKTETITTSVVKKKPMFPDVDLDMLLHPAMLHLSFFCGMQAVMATRCNVCDTSTQRYIYVLICLHYICRKCLATAVNKKIECCICKCVSRLSDITLKQ